MAKTIPTTARVRVLLPACNPLASPALVKMRKPPTKSIINARKPIRGMVAIRILPKKSDRQLRPRAVSVLVQSIRGL